MSLDLFFAPRGADFIEARAPGLVPTAATRRARVRIVKQLIAAHPGAKLEGDRHAGRLCEFPRGDLLFEPGVIHWALHGVSDVDAIQEIVDWFFERGWVCDDPQGAGFGNAGKKSDDATATLQDYDEIEGARLVSVRLEREWGSGLGLEWMLADGRALQLHFATFVACRIPDLGELLDLRVAAVVVEPTTVGRFGHDFRIRFGTTHELGIDGAIYRTSTITKRQ